MSLGTASIQSASDVMRPSPEVKPSATLREMTEYLAENDCGAVVVTRGSRLIGILSERDIARAVADGVDPDVERVDDHMSYEVTTVTKQASLSEVFSAMADGAIRHLPVLDGDVVVGMISAIDLLRFERDVHRSAPSAVVSFHDRNGFERDLLAAFVRDDHGVHLILNESRPRTKALMECEEVRVHLDHGLDSVFPAEEFVGRVRVLDRPSVSLVSMFRQTYGAPMSDVTGREVLIEPTQLRTVFEPARPQSISDPRTGLNVLDEVACRRYLKQSKLGRVAVSTRGLIDVLPVTYGIVEGDIVFRTVPGQKLVTIDRSPNVTFEIDDFDPETGAGWSVVVRGSARQVTEPDRVEAFGAAGITPWAPSVAESWVAIAPWKITGRRLA